MLFRNFASGEDSHTICLVSQLLEKNAVVSELAKQTQYESFSRRTLCIRDPFMMHITLGDREEPFMRIYIIDTFDEISHAETFLEDSYIHTDAIFYQLCDAYDKVIL